MARPKRIEGDPGFVMSDTGVLVREMSDDRGTPELQRQGEVHATTTNVGKETRMVNKTTDLLLRLLKAKVTPLPRPAYNAGRMFEEVFHAARANPSATIALEGVGGGQHTNMAEGTLAAKERLNGAMTALGGHSSPVAGVVWHCLGNGLTLKEWCTRSGSPKNQQEAKGILVAGLTVLAGHWSVGDAIDEG